MTISYSIGFDLNDDGDYSDSNESLGVDVIQARWWLGMAQPYDLVCASSGAEITLINSDGSYSPEDSGIKYVPGHRVRIQSNDGTTRTHFIGLATGIEMVTADTGRAEAILHCVGIDEELRHESAEVGLQIDVTADEIIQAVIDEITVRYAVLDGYLVLDQGSLGDKLFGSSWDTSFEVGKSSFAYVGDLWPEQRKAWEVLSEAVAGECGRLFVNRTGQLVFYSRHHTIEDLSSDATFTDDVRGLEYGYGNDVVNEVAVTIYPREVGADDETLWELEKQQIVRVGEAGRRTVRVVFREENDRRIGALKIYPPVAGQDYVATRDLAGNKPDQSDKLRLKIVQELATGALLELKNDYDRTLVLQTGAKIRGQALIAGDPMIAEYRDQASVTAYGLRREEMKAVFLDNSLDGESLVRHVVAQKKAASGLVRWVELDRVTHSTQALARTLFDRIRVVDTAKGHDARYLIVREEHDVKFGHKVRWLLELTDNDRFFVLNQHKPNGTRVLAY